MYLWGERVERVIDELGMWAVNERQRPHSDTPSRLAMPTM